MFAVKAARVHFSSENASPGESAHLSTCNILILVALEEIIFVLEDLGRGSTAALGSSDGNICHWFERLNVDLQLASFHFFTYGYDLVVCTSH